MILYEASRFIIQQTGEVAFGLDTPFCDGIIPALVLRTSTRVQHSHVVPPVYGRAFACPPMTPDSHCRSHQQLRRTMGLQPVCRSQRNGRPRSTHVPFEIAVRLHFLTLDATAMYFVLVCAISFQPAERLPERFDLSAAASRPPRTSVLAERRSTVRLTPRGMRMRFTRSFMSSLQMATSTIVSQSLLMLFPHTSICMNPQRAIDVRRRMISPVWITRHDAECNHTRFVPNTIPAALLPYRGPLSWLGSPCSWRTNQPISLRYSYHRYRCNCVLR
ncbi:hypothetical protein V8C44DRAFT_181403 [Trichoderma aethiopicum]